MSETSNSCSTSRKRALRVLIADDYPDCAESAAAVLSLEKFQTQVAHDGEEALARASTWRPHVCVLDLGMPGLDGYQLARRLREESWADGALLIALTGWTSAKDQAQALRAGFDFCVHKPAEPQSLLRMIASRVTVTPSTD
jgi:CheY-like chemotaxis protein